MSRNEPWRGTSCASARRTLGGSNAEAAGRRPQQTAARHFDRTDAGGQTIEKIFFHNLLTASTEAYSSCDS
jgi:hypothetical protein